MTDDNTDVLEAAAMNEIVHSENPHTDAFQFSIAISLKRVADAMDRMVASDGAINSYTKAG